MQLPDVGVNQDSEMDIGRVISIELSVEVHGERVDFFAGKNFTLNLLFYVLQPGQLILWGVVSLARLDAESSRMPQRHAKRMALFHPSAEVQARSRERRRIPGSSP